MSTAAQRIAAFATSLRVDAIPPAVVEAATLHLLDALGCGLAAHALGAGTAGRAVEAEAGGRPESTVIGLERALPAASAALANGMLCHALDYDDTHADAICHVTAVVGPAALAVAEAGGASGRELVAALVVGSEVVPRLGQAASGAFHRRGFHPTAVCGIFGAVAAAARLEGLDIATTESALGLAGSMASGLLAYLEPGTPTKPLHPAWAAHGAVTATRLAAHGAKGPSTVLEGRFGLYHAFLGVEAIVLEPTLADLGSRWELPRIAFKPYPACHLMHGALGAAAEALAGRRLLPGEVEDVLVTVPEPVVPIVLEPAAAKARPRTGYDAKFSLPFSIAAMIVHGTVGLGTYADAAVGDADILEIARRVRYEVKPYWTYPSAYPGHVRIRLRGGPTLEAEHLHQRGAPDHPLGADGVRAKFRDNAALALPEPAVHALERAVLALPETDDVPAALSPLRLASQNRPPVTSSTGGAAARHLP